MREILEWDSRDDGTNLPIEGDEKLWEKSFHDVFNWKFLTLRNPRRVKWTFFWTLEDAKASTTEEKMINSFVKHKIYSRTWINVK